MRQPQPKNPDQWALEGGAKSERVVFLFIVPYGAKEETHAARTCPDTHRRAR